MGFIIYAKTTLVATAQHDTNVYMSARNIDGVTISRVADLNALTVLRPRQVLVTKAALDSIRERATADKGASADKGATADKGE